MLEWVGNVLEDNKVVSAFHPFLVGQVTLCFVGLYYLLQGFLVFVVEQLSHTGRCCRFFLLFCLGFFLCGLGLFGHIL